MIPLVETGGNWRDIGYDIGHAFREQIQAAAASRDGLADFGPTEIAERIEPYLNATREHAPDIIAELDGMAAGSGVALEVLFAINAAEELGQAAGRFGCSVVGVTPAGTADGHVLMAHNEDASAGWADYTYVIRAEPATGPSFVAFSYAGLLLHQGLNAVGLASVGNALYARDAHPGIPKLFQYRRAIIEPTIEDAIRVAADPNRAFGNNHLLANREGDIYDVEVSGRHWRLMAAENRFLAHANHFVHPDLAHLDVDDDLLNSRLRQHRMERLVDQAWGELSIDRLKAIMSDHSNYPKSVCKHHAPESDLDYGTIGSVVIDLTAGYLWACSGNPCRAQWRCVELPSTPGL